MNNLNKVVDVSSSVVTYKNLPKVFSFAGKTTSWIGWGLLAFDAIMLTADIVKGIFDEKDIDVDEDELQKFLTKNGEIFMYVHSLLNPNLSKYFLFNVYSTDPEDIAGDLNDDGKIDVLDVLQSDISTLRINNDSAREAIEDAIKSNDIKAYVRSILAIKAGTPYFSAVIENIYQTWLAYSYYPNVWRAFPPESHTKFHAAQFVISDVYKIIVTDPIAAPYVHNYSKYALKEIEDIILDEIPAEVEEDLDDVFNVNHFSWDNSFRV